MTDKAITAKAPSPEGALAVAGLLFFFSGASSLIYEIIWVKQLTLQFGATAWSVSTVVTAFMAGLGAGGWYAGRRADAISQPFLVYAFIEVGIAVFGFLSIPILSRLDVLIGPIYHLLQDHFTTFVLVRFVLTLAVLIVPTFLMGASLPVLVAGLARSHAMQRTVGLLYGLNTLGAAAGVIASGFVLLPALGMSITTLVAVTIGVLVSLCAWRYDKRWQVGPVPEKKQESGRRAPFSLLAIVAVSGILSLFYEVSWTRLIVPIVGSCTYAFSIILATFLLGIGVGSMIASLGKGRRDCRPLIASLLIFSSCTGLAGLFAVDHLPGLFLALVRHCEGKLWLFFYSQGVLAGALIFLPSCAMGVILPLAIAGYHRETGARGQSVGGIYAANTAGSIAGSVLAGFVALPYLGVSLCIIVAAAAGLVAAIFLLFSDHEISRWRRILWVVGSTAVFASLLRFNPQIDFHFLHSSQFRNVLNRNTEYERDHMGDLLYIKDGISCTVTVYRYPDSTWLNVNGKTDASTALFDRQSQYLMGHLPLLFHPAPAKVFILGLGSGGTVRAVAAHPVDKIDVAELEPAIKEAARYFASIHDGAIFDDNVHIHMEDGHTFLRYREDKYDVIISEPSNPWMAGVSALFTTEYYRQIENRLNPRGIFCQWIQLYEISEETRNVMVRTLADVFPHVMLFCYRSDMFCLASREKIMPDIGEIERRLQLPGVRLTMDRILVRDVYDLFTGYWGELPEDVAAFPTQIRNSEENLWLEYRAPIEMYRSTSFKKIGIIGSAAEHLERMEHFFAHLPAEETALRLAAAIRDTMPGSWPVIAGWSEICGEERTARLLKQTADESKARWERIKRAKLQRNEAKELVFSQPAKALEIFEEILDLEPEKGSTYRYMAEACALMNQHDLAFQYYRKAIDLNELDYVSHCNLGSLYYLQGKWTEGNTHFETAMEIDPYYLQGRAVWTTILGRTGQGQKARLLAEESRRILPDRQYETLQRLLKSK